MLSEAETSLICFQTSDAQEQERSEILRSAQNAKGWFMRWPLATAQAGAVLYVETH